MQSIITAFDDRESAQRAADNLVAEGIPRAAVHVQSGYDADNGAGSTRRTGDDADQEGFFASIGDFFGRLFGDDDSAGKYAETVRRGGTVLVVDAASDTEAQTVRSLLAQSAGSVDVEDRAARWRSEEGWTGYNAGSGTFAATAAQTGAIGAAAEGETVLPVVQEELNVGKRTVEGGVVRVVQRVTETPVSELVRLREERATIERRPVDRAATAAELSNLQDTTIEVRESAEQAVVGKTARVVEEVVVGKEVTEREESVSDTVRRTDVEVERDATRTASDLTTGRRV